MKLNILKYTILFVASLSIGCGEIKEGFTQNKISKNDVKTPLPKTIELYKDKLVDKELPILSLREGMEIEMLIKGISATPIFGPLYKKTIKTSWNKKKCEQPWDVERCHSIPKKGQCYPRHRDFLNFEENVIDFEVNPIKLKMYNGDWEFNLNNVVYKEDFWYQLTVYVDKEMAEKGKLFIAPIVMKREPDTKVGFVDYGDISKCKGFAEPDFKFHGSRDSRMMNSQKSESYFVTVTLRQ